MFVYPSEKILVGVMGVYKPVLAMAIVAYVLIGTLRVFVI